MRNEDFVKSYINEMPKQKGVALDIGANHGLYTSLLAAKFDLIYAFEPHPDNVVTINENINVDNVIVEQKAIGVEDGNITLYINKYNHGGHSMARGLAEHGTWGHSVEDYIEIEAISIDTFCKDKDVKFIKCDIEGGEYSIFYGASETLKNKSPEIIVETHQVSNFDEDQKSRNKLLDFFESFGYSIYNDRGEKVSRMRFDSHYLVKK